MPRTAKRRKTAKRKTTRRYAKPVILKVIGKQSGVRKSISRDRQRKALPPGKRRSRTGRIYWETRKNRSDKRGRSI